MKQPRLGLNLYGIVRALAFAIALGPTAAALAAGPTKLDEAMSHDGLQKIEIKGIDLAYALPGASLAGYTKVRLDPVKVSFHKDWDPTRQGSRLKLSDADRERIRTDVADIVAKEFTAALRKGQAYVIVDQPGPDVLGVAVSIVNLIVNAPDTQSAGRSRSYVASAGEMTLVAELRDSQSGQVVARVVDRTESRSTGRMMVADRFTNSAEASDAAAAWARVLRNSLDKARGIGGK
jgi:hypothetical protein